MEGFPGAFSCNAQNQLPAFIRKKIFIWLPPPNLPGQVRFFCARCALPQASFPVRAKTLYKRADFLNNAARMQLSFKILPCVAALLYAAACSNCGDAPKNKFAADEAFLKQHSAPNSGVGSVLCIRIATEPFFCKC